MREASRRRKILWVLAALALAGASTAYGFLLHQARFFPYHQLRRLYLRIAPPEATSPFLAARPDPGTPLSPDAIGKLSTLPYLAGYRPASASGVRMEDRSLSQDGWTFYTSGHAPVVTLIDMDGRVAKTWTVDVPRTFPEAASLRANHELRIAHVYPDGGILAMISHCGLARLDAESRVVWAYHGYVHHDFVVESSGAIWVLEKRERLIPGLGRGEPIWEDFAVQISPEGRLVRRISLLEALRESRYAPMLTRVPTDLDIFHTNSIFVLDGTLASRSPAFRRGNILLSFHHLGLLGILDPEEKKIVWALSGQWHGQHAASLLPTGRLLLFDNFGSMHAASRVLEVDPFTQEIVWTWGAGPGQRLYTEANGGQQRLGNGNTLISEANFGRAVEVTPDGRVVWEFWNPYRAGQKGELIATLYQIRRLPRDVAFMARAGAP
jgi:Arylsulfotransferase (ASST)